MKTTIHSRTFSKRLGLMALTAFTAGGIFLAGCGTESDEPSFPEKYIVLTNPKGGETYKVGQKIEVKWKLQGTGRDAINNVDIDLSNDSGKTWAPISGGSIPDTDPRFGNFPWTIPDTLSRSGLRVDLKGKDCLMRVQQYSTAIDSQLFVSKKTFRINP